MEGMREAPCSPILSQESSPSSPGHAQPGPATPLNYYHRIIAPIKPHVSAKINHLQTHPRIPAHGMLLSAQGKTSSAICALQADLGSPWGVPQLLVLPRHPSLPCTPSWML